MLACGSSPGTRAEADVPLPVGDLVQCCRRTRTVLSTAVDVPMVKPLLVALRVAVAWLAALVGLLPTAGGMLVAQFLVNARHQKPGR